MKPNIKTLDQVCAELKNSVPENQRRVGFTDEKVRALGQIVCSGYMSFCLAIEHLAEESSLTREDIIFTDDDVLDSTELDIAQRDPFV